MQEYFMCVLLTQHYRLQENKAHVYFPPRTEHCFGSQETLNKYLLNKMSYYCGIALSNLKVIKPSVYQLYYIISSANKN